MAAFLGPNSRGERELVFYVWMESKRHWGKRLAAHENGAVQLIYIVEPVKASSAISDLCGVLLFGKAM